jgi:phenylacetate-CoA ligase
MYFDKGIETAPKERVEEVQFARPKSMIEFVYEENPFYRKRFTENTLSPEDIRSIEDITKLPKIFLSF